MQPGVGGCLDGREYGELATAMGFNSQAKYLLRDTDKKSASWMNEAIVFLYGEFVKADPYAPGQLKHRRLLQFKVTEDRTLLTYARQRFQPFLDLCEEYRDWKRTCEKCDESCLVVTALPLEFRAIVRRLSFLLEVTWLPHQNGSRFKVDDPFRWVFTPANDEYTFDLWDSPSKTRERPFLLVARGTIGTNSRRRRITVILLPMYGGHLAQKGVDMIRPEIVFRELLVVGVAGKLTQERSLKRGHVIVSGNIYDSTLTKRATKAKGGQLFINNDDPWRFPDPSFCPNNWRPVLHEKWPEGDNGGGHPGSLRVWPRDVISGSSVVKAQEYKELLRRYFPNTCWAVEMESLGCCHALGRTNPIPVRVIKSLCDDSNGLKNKKWQPFCADVAAAFATDYMLSVYGDKVT